MGTMGTRFPRIVLTRINILSVGSALTRDKKENHQRRHNPDQEQGLNKSKTQSILGHSADAQAESNQHYEKRFAHFTLHYLDGGRQLPNETELYDSTICPTVMS